MRHFSKAVTILLSILFLMGCQGEGGFSGPGSAENGEAQSEHDHSSHEGSDNSGLGDVTPLPEDEPNPDPVPEEETEVVEDGETFRCVKSAFHQTNFLEQNLVDSSVGVQASCIKATSAQRAQVNLGNTKLKKFLNRCYAETGNSCWCNQMIRPNPSSINTFKCTYGTNQPHQLIHPDENTWKHPIAAVNIVRDLEKQGVRVKIIYNWWRPEPYNKNVGGSATRHPFGTSIDVRFVSKSDQSVAHRALCGMRKQGRIRAVGFYQSTALHLGVGDHNGNTWGRSCSY